MKFWLMTFAAVISTSLLAQPQAPKDLPGTASVPPDATPTITTDLPPAGPITSAPAPKPAKKKPVKKPAAKKQVEELKTVPLVPGPASVDARHVNVRTRAGLAGEVITRLTNSQPVTVIEEIHLKHSGPDEPSAWAKIVLPGDASAWVNSKYIDASTKTVTAKKLNVRGGPSEDYGVIGMLRKGDVVNETGAQGDWTKIEAPADGYAFVAAQYLKQETPGEITSTPAEAISTNAGPAVMPTEVPENTAIAPAPTEAPEAATENAATNGTPSVEPETTPTPAPQEPPPPRVVAHEGIVRGSVSIQAPTPYALIAPDTGAIVDYLYTNSKELDLSRYKGLRIVVTGEESLDARWPHTPLITIQKIQVIE